MDAQQASPGEAVPLATLTGSEWLSFMVGFFWRGIVYTILCMILGAAVGGVVGAVIGAAMGAGGASAQSIATVVRPIGFVLGLAVGFGTLRWYIGWLLRSRYGDLRLVVVRDSARLAPLTTDRAINTTA